MTTISKAEIEAQIKLLKSEWICVAHNEGTWSQAEAARLIGTSNPEFANYEKSVRVGDGAEREKNQRAVNVGRLRVSYDSLNEARAKLRELQDLLKKS